MKIAIILGTSRENGNTANLARAVADYTKASLFSLADYSVLPFDYEFKNQNDDFDTLINQLIKFDTIIFATPVYWYSPSAQLKVFMDRISDLLKVKKPLGRQLREKSVAVLATGSDVSPKNCFEEIFHNTFAYLGMNYLGMLYCPCGENIQIQNHLNEIQSFCSNNLKLTIGGINAVYR